MLPLLFLALSIAFWIQRWRTRIDSPPWLPVEPREDTPIPMVAFIAACLWISLMSLAVLAMTFIPEIAAAAKNIKRISPVELIAEQVLVGLVAWLLLTRFGTRSPRVWGIHLQNVWSQIKDGALGFIAAIGPVTIVGMLLYPLRGPADEHILIRLIRNDPSGSILVASIITAGILAPLVEELLFRVILQGGLTRFMPVTPAWIGSSLIFGFIHGYPDGLAIAVLGLVLGYVYERRNSYIAAVTTHALFNAMNLMMLMVEIYFPE